MLTTHNVIYALQHINDIFPDPESRPNMDSCPSRFSVCISHLLNDSYLFHKEAGTRTVQSGAHSGHAESWLSRIRDNQDYAEKIVIPK